MVEDLKVSSKGSGVTASRTVARSLLRNVLDGGLQPGEKLPTERELAEQFKVSRHVVREALKRLEALGLLRIQQGSGIYAADIGLSGGLELFEYGLLHCFDDLCVEISLPTLAAYLGRHLFKNKELAFPVIFVLDQLIFQFTVAKAAHYGSLFLRVRASIHLGGNGR